jgi:DNA polymerase III delta prime subunit
MQGNIMNFKYNPGFSSEEDLIDAFVVRQKELQQILQTIQENTGRTYQHLLLVGARGTGKTMLVRRVAAEIRRSPELNQHWYPLVFGEESYRILSAGEFWLEALNHLAAQNSGAQWQGVYEELRGERDEKRLQQRAIAKLMDFADAQNKQILLIVENLNMLFDEQMSAGDDWDLRHTLQNEPRLMLLGTATQRFDEIDNVDKAWFEFFALHTMEPLRLPEICQLWSSIAEENLSENQMRPIQILTGGNPRLLQVLASVSKGMSFRDLMANLTQLIDSHTDYFKSLLENLPATERKVFVELLEFWKPTSTNEIAKATRLDVNKASALLKRLLDRGAIEVVAQPSKKKYYQVSERLFNIYYLMRKRGDSSDRIKIVIDFMDILYSDLLTQAEKIASEALDLPKDLRRDHLLALFDIMGRISDNEMLRDFYRAMPADLGEDMYEIVSERATRIILSHPDKMIDMMNEKILSLEMHQSMLSSGHDFSFLELMEISVRILELHVEIFRVIRLLTINNSNENAFVISQYDRTINSIKGAILENVFTTVTFGYEDANQLLKILTEVQPATFFMLEPIIVSLRIFLGEEHPLVAQEIFEVGKDIADRIRSKQAELATLPQKGVEAADMN